MSLATLRNTAAAAALVAFVTAKDGRRKKRDGGASILSPDQNPDLRDDCVDLIADLLIWAKGQGLDAAYIARVGASHATPDALAEDYAVEAAVDERAAARGRWNLRLTAKTPEERAQVARDTATAQGVATYQGYSCLAYVDRLGGVVITDTDDGRDAYVQPGDDAARLRAELDAAEATPEPTTSAGLGAHDLIQNILREYF